jgi:hypothetical protein
VKPVLLVLLRERWTSRQTYEVSTVPVASEREEWEERGERAFSVPSDTIKLRELPELAPESRVLELSELVPEAAEL